MLNEIDLSRADLNLLVLFEAVLGEGHVGRAADRLNLTPSAVSHGLGRLRRLLNDPLFLKTPRGVTATARAQELAEPIADVLARLRSVLASAEPFDPATSTRRFTIGAPDGSSAVVLTPLLAALREQAPGIDIGIRQLLPIPGETGSDRAWRDAFADLDDQRMDVAIMPSEAIPLRFEVRRLYEEEFVVAARRGHACVRDPGLELYCMQQHVVVSHGADPHGFIDDRLAALGHKRRVTLTVPNCFFALAVLAETDLVSALPSRFVAIHAERFGVVGLPLPLPPAPAWLNALTPKVALMDAGLAWLFDLVTRGAADG